MTTLTAPTGARAAAGRSRAIRATAGLATLTVLAVSASMLVGARAVPLTALFDPGDPMHAIYAARMQRTALALAVGGALGLAGACMQGLTRNPLADPGLLGVNAGASFAMVLGISVFGVSGLQDQLWFAFAGAAAAALLVHAIGALGRGGATPIKLAVTGAALTAAVTSWTSGALLIDLRTMETFRMWQVGTVGGRGLDVLLIGLPFLLVGAALAMTGARFLNGVALGDDLARGLGRRLVLDRGLMGTAIVLLAGTATALAGPIAFVGLIVAHGVRALVGSNYALVLPLSAAAGGVLTVVADTAGRVVLPPAEVQVGIMTAVIGAPIFLYLVRRGRMASL